MGRRSSSLNALRMTRFGADRRRRNATDVFGGGLFVGWLWVRDLADRIRGRRSPLLPPRRHRRFIGNGDFLGVGRKIVDTLVTEHDLRPHHSVLEPGCGAGRVAVALMPVLNSGSYHGFDVVGHAIDWCRRAITSRAPRFLFTQANIYHEIYNPRGTRRAEQYVFPADDNSADFVVMTSVLTHLRPAEVRNYLAQTARVLRSGGTCFVTGYFVDEPVLRRVREGRTAFTFTHDMGEYLVHSDKEETYAVAYRLDSLLDNAAAVGLRLASPMTEGSWSRSTRRPASQDALVLVPEERGEPG